MIGITSFALAGCATSMGSRTRDNDSLKQQVASLEGQVNTLTQQLEDVSQRQQTIETRLQARQAPSTNFAVAKTGATLSAREIQIALKSTGFYEGSIDGKLGPRTREAVKAFQRSKGLTPDGKVGAKTASALAKALPSSSSTEQTPQ